MRQMKDSGIEWIGEIPEDWEQIRLKSLFTDRNGGAWGDEAKNDANDIICIRVADFDFEKQTVKDGEKTLRNYQSQVIDKLKLQENDLLIEKSGGGEKTPVGRTILATGCQGVLFANFIDRLRIRKSHNSKFIAYLFRSLYSNGITFPYVKQTTGIQNLDVENLLREVVFVPEVKDQQKIAYFLDDKCAKIDSLIAHEEATIEELKAYKQSVITEAVTKGLDKSVPMKDSGIAWIGTIPAAWEVVRMKNLGRCRNGLTYSPDNLVSEEEGALVLRSSNIKDGKLFFTDNVYVNSEIKDELMVKTNDILICSRNGSRALIGKNALIPEGLNASFGAFMMVFRCKSPQYVRMILNSEVFSYYLGTFLTATINQLTADNFNNMKIVYCNDMLEQQQITDYLEKKCANIDRLISIKQQKIEELKEYKKSLSYEYVTGKKEVV